MTNNRTAHLFPSTPAPTARSLPNRTSYIVHRTLAAPAAPSLLYTYRFMRSRNLGFTELTLLTLLADDSLSHTLSSLASTLHCTPGCLSPILHRLEACSLIYSFPSHHDKRKTYYTLTPSDGTSLIQSFLNPRASGALSSKS